LSLASSMPIPRPGGIVGHTATGLNGSHTSQHSETHNPISHYRASGSLPLSIHIPPSSIAATDTPANPGASSAASRLLQTLDNLDLGYGKLPPHKNSLAERK
jgi:hypothetical protein